MCLLGSAEELCYETRPPTAGLPVVGPALPGNPETNTHTHDSTHSGLFVYCYVGAAVCITHLNSLLWLKANEITEERRVQQR